MIQALRSTIAVALVLIALHSQTHAQVENPDYRIRASMRDANDHSVGNVEFRVKSRYMQVYYGGVQRKDEYRIVVGLDDSSFANRDFDVYVGDIYMGRSRGDSSGLVDTTYRSDWKPDDAPDRRLPANFPDPVTVGMMVSVFDPLSNALLMSAALEERFKRGDVDQDGKVDEDDYVYLAQRYGQPGVGPASGDFTGDNFADAADYRTLLSNWTDRDPAPAAPILTGDATLDGRVDGADFEVWNANRFTSGGDVTTGDFNGDGTVDGADFDVWSVNRTRLAAGVATTAVPEPSTGLMISLSVMMFVGRGCSRMCC